MDNEDGSFLWHAIANLWNSMCIASKTKHTFMVTALRTSKLKLKEYRRSFTWVSRGQPRNSLSCFTSHTLKHRDESRIKHSAGWQHRVAELLLHEDSSSCREETWSDWSSTSNCPIEILPSYCTKLSQDISSWTLSLVQQRLSELKGLDWKGCNLRLEYK
jgi:hypothetical protein